MIEILPNWHPVFVHFTVALLFTATVLFWIGWAVREWPLGATILTVAHWTLWIGAGITVATVAAGFYAVNTVAHPDAAHAPMENHHNWGIWTAVLWWAIALWDGWQVKKGRAIAVPFLAALLIAVGLLAVTAYKGGEVVYGYGAGVEAVPSSDSGHMHGGDEHMHGDPQDHMH